LSTLLLPPLEEFGFFRCVALFAVVVCLFIGTIGEGVTRFFAIG
jgi:hypothetical protein